MVLTKFLVIKFHVYGNTYELWHLNGKMMEFLPSRNIP